MTALRHISIGLVALLVLVLGAAWLVPPWLDWNRYRDDVAALASDALGHAVRIEGAITLRVLPEPLLVADRVSVAASGAATVTAEHLHLRIALAPLVAGRVEARELVLRGADIRLPWPPDPAALALRTPSWLSAMSARIERGRLQIGEVAVTGVEATLATSDISGSFISNGRAHGGGRDWVFTARISRPGGDGAVGIDVTLDGQGGAQGTGVIVSGQMQADGTMLGRVALRGPDLSQLVPAPAVAFRVEGRLTSGDGLVAADELAGELAGAPIKGAIALRLLPRLRLDVALTTGRLDLDAWGPALLRGAEGGLARLPVGIDLSADAAVWAGGTLRGLRGAFDIAGGTVEVREARALLPGETALQLRGRLAAGADPRRLRFEGTAGLRAASLRTTLAWAAGAGLGPVDALPPGVLRNADIEGQVVLNGGEVVLSDLAGRIDGGAVVASLAWRPGPRPALRTVATAERIDLDAWLPGAWPGLPAAAALFGPFALDLHLQAERATWHGVALAPLELELAAEPGRITLRKLAAQGLGATLTASGTLLERGRLADAKAELRTERAAGLAPVLDGLLGPELAARLAPLMRAPASLQLQASGAPESLGLKLAASLADLRLEATPTLDLPAGRWAGAVTLRHPGAPRLAETLGLSGATGWLGDGSLALVAQLEGAPGRLGTESFSLAAGGLRLGGALRLERGDVARLSGRIAAESLMLPLPFPRSPDPLAADVLLGWEADIALSARTVSVARERLLEAASAKVTLARGRLRVDGLAAQLAGGSLTGELAFDAGARPPSLALDAVVQGAAGPTALFDTALDLGGGTLDAVLRLSGGGFSPAGLLASLGGTLSLNVRDGVLAGFDLARMGKRLEEVDLRAALAGGATAFERLVLEATIDRGGATLARAALSGPAGTATATGTIDLIRAALGLRFALVPAVPDAPEIGLRVTGPADSVERVPELAGAVRWRAEHPP